MAAKKMVQIIARYQFKSDTRKVVYLVRASNGKDQYETSFFAGKATSCTCKAKKPCYHMVQLEVIEAGRAVKYDWEQNPAIIGSKAYYKAVHAPAIKAAQEISDQRTVVASVIATKINESLGAPLVKCGVKPVIEKSAAHRATAPLQSRAFSLLR